MGNWNRHFVRVDSSGYLGIFEPLYGLEIMRLQPIYYNNNQNAYTLIYIPSGNELELSSENNILNSPTAPYGIYRMNFRGGNVGKATETINGDEMVMQGLATIQGSPDLRIGVTAADASPITIYSSTASGTRYEVKARILATSGSSATYTISWTEGGAAQKVALTITAVDTEVHDNFVVAPDSGTDITAQITSLTSSTVNVDAIVSVLG